MPICEGCNKPFERNQYNIFCDDCGEMIEQGKIDESEMTEDSKLPEGKTCRDCIHWKRCEWLIGELSGSETECDWTPSRFKEKEGVSHDQ